MLRGALPKGVPNMLCATPPFVMNRTWLLETVTAAGLVAFRALRLTRVFAGSAHWPTSVNRLHASPANTPTELAGALELPRNGRAVSTLLLKAAKNAES